MNDVEVFLQESEMRLTFSKEEGMLLTLIEVHLSLDAGELSINLQMEVI
jgi:hypothetical protein